jgi:phage replication O-like protein O
MQTPDPETTEPASSAPRRRSLHVPPNGQAGPPSRGAEPLPPGGDGVADPQLENGYTRIANELLEALVRLRCPPVVLAATLAVIRETYGYNRKTAPIARSRLAEVMGLSYERARHALSEAVAWGIVIREGRELGLQKDYSKWAKPADRATGFRLTTQPDVSADRATENRSGTQPESVRSGASPNRSGTQPENRLTGQPTKTSKTKDRRQRLGCTEEDKEDVHPTLLAHDAKACASCGKPHGSKDPSKMGSEERTLNRAFEAMTGKRMSCARFALDLALKKSGKKGNPLRGIAGLIELIGATDDALIDELLAAPTCPRLPEGKQPWAWFSKAFRAAISRPWEWKDTRKPEEELEWQRIYREQTSDRPMNQF